MTGHNPITAIIEKHRNNCSFYVKLDLGILTIIGTIASILRLEKLEVFRFVSKIEYIVLFLIVLLGYGLIFDRLLLGLWDQIEFAVTDGTPFIKWVSRGTTIQVISHVLFIGLVGALALGSVSGYISGYDAALNVISIQQEIENFALEEKRFPKDIDELVNKFPITKFNIEELGTEQINYSTDETRGYILRYAGRDGKLNTPDDKIYDHESYAKFFKKDVSKTQKESPEGTSKD